MIGSYIMSDDAVVLILSILIGCIIYISVDKYLCYKVKRTSDRYRVLKNLNQRFSFDNSVQSVLNLYKKEKSKRNWERFDVNKYFNSIIDADMEYFEGIERLLEHNLDEYERYEAELQKLPSYRRGMFKYFEKRECLKIVYKPMLDIKIYIYDSYTSPKGRNTYKSDYVFNYECLKKHMSEVKRQRQRKQTTSYQRSLMSDSLRYDILQRDGFRCVLCGRTAQDGVKLHVDHIVPIAKGGKTISSNLRTLCEACNLGKSDKYNEGKLN